MFAELLFSVGWKVGEKYIVCCIWNWLDCPVQTGKTILALIVSSITRKVEDELLTNSYQAKIFALSYILST